MSINLLDLVKDQVTGTLASQASGFLGESESGITKALGGIFPAILGGAIEKASSPQSSGGLMDLIGGLDLGGLSDIAGIFGGGPSKVNGLLNSGGGILDMLLGNKTSGIIDFIANMAGLKSSSSSSLLKMAAPLLMGIIGKQIKGKGLGFLTDLLMGQKKSVAAAMPSGMGGLLGFSALGDLGNKAGDVVKGAVGAGANAAKGAVGAGANAAKGAASAVTETASSGMGMLKWLLPLLLGALALYFIAGKGCAKNVTETATDAMGTVTDAAKDAGGAVADAGGAVADGVADMAAAIGAKFSQVDDVALEALNKLSFEAGSAGASMKSYIDGGFEGDPLFRFKNLKFATGSSALDGAAQAEVDNIASILKAYTGVNAEIGGHTDNTGNADSNKALSQARAAAVVGRLIAQGISNDRLTAMGYGQDSPVASNDTAEGRVENRRTEIKIVD